MNPPAVPFMPGVPAAGHIAGGFWHPGQIDGCPKCEPRHRRNVHGVDLDAILGGDTITYTAARGGGEETGTVEYATSAGAHVIKDGRQYRIDWQRVTGHQPKNDRRGR